MGSISETAIVPGGDCLLVLDSRTAKSYQIPIQNKTIQGADVSKIVAPYIDEKGNASSEITRPLHILDQGLENIACMKSAITLP